MSDILPVVVQQITQTALTLRALYQVIAPILLGQPDQIIDDEPDQEAIHQRCGVGVDHQGIGCENSAADGVDHSQFDHR